MRVRECKRESERERERERERQVDVRVMTYWWVKEVGERVQERERERVRAESLKKDGYRETKKQREGIR